MFKTQLSIPEVILTIRRSEIGSTTNLAEIWNRGWISSLENFMVSAGFVKTKISCAQFPTKRTTQ